MDRTDQDLRDTAAATASGLIGLRMMQGDPVAQAGMLGSLAVALISAGFNHSANVAQAQGESGLDIDTRAAFLAAFGGGFASAPPSGVADVLAAVCIGMATGTADKQPHEVAQAFAADLTRATDTEEARAEFEELRADTHAQHEAHGSRIGPHGIDCDCPAEDGPALVSDEDAAELRRMFEAGQ